MDQDTVNKYLTKYENALFVIKYGGKSLFKENSLSIFINNLSKLYNKYINLVVIHGGGPALTEEMNKKNLSVEFKDGMRISTKETMEVVADVFKNLNLKICNALKEKKCHAKPCYDGHIIQSKLLKPASQEHDSINYVGRVHKINLDYFNKDEIPVISSLGQSIGHPNDPLIKPGTLLNINADYLAMKIAIHLKAHKLIFISDVDGIYLDPNDPQSKITHATESYITELIKKNILVGGMKLKVNMAIRALKEGEGHIKKVHFINGSIPNALLKEVLTVEGIGTEIVLDGVEA